MILKYIYHSGFLLELENCSFIFDYYKGDIPEIRKDKKLYVFSTHAHKDHYNEKIFDIFGSYKDVEFILSDDIEVKNPEFRKRAKFISINSNYTIDKLNIETFESTDEGIAIMIEVDGKTIYHSGDLNWWTWLGFESEEEYQSMTDKFKKEIDKMKNKKIDLAMMVLDSRQGERFDWGMKYFLENTNTSYVAPMHCWDKFEVIDKFKEKHPQLASKTKIIYTNKIGREGYIID
ncbi:MAG: MBL fold metallo-hydrolase [Peptostreptococcus sp.]|uniref:MBL fold metallo-hydrolase n=1 Tax=Peptostreptococcus sp. TaxID=1262 RepID=UPI002FC68BA0